MSGSESKVESRKLRVKQELIAVWTRVSNFGFRVSDFAARVPWKLVLGATGLFILALPWREHDARLRRDLELQQMRQQTSVQVAALRAHADALLRAANEKNARVIRDLDSRRRQLEREGEELRRRLLRLREDEGKQVAEVASLPAAELAERLKSRVSGFGVRPAAQRLWPTGRGSGLGARPAAQRLWPTGRGSGLNEQASGVGGRVPETRGSGLGLALRDRDSGLGTRDSGSEEPASGVGGQVSGNELSDDQTRKASENSAAPDTRHLNPGTLPVPSPQRLAPSPGFSVPSPESRVPGPQFVLTEEGARRVETAFIELDSCRAQAAVKDGELANCQEQVAANRAAVGEMNQSLQNLNQAIHLKDEILTRVKGEHQAELKAARGSRLGRFVRAVQYVGVGVVIGLVAR